jgi:hypothetical protein
LTTRPTGVVTQIDGKKVCAKPPLADLLRHAGESEERVLGTDGEA